MTSLLQETVTHLKIVSCYDRYDSFSAALIEHAPIKSVYIYFDTATFDEIERDVKVTLKAALVLNILSIILQCFLDGR